MIMALPSLSRRLETDAMARCWDLFVLFRRDGGGSN